MTRDLIRRRRRAAKAAGFTPPPRPADPEGRGGPIDPWHARASAALDRGDEREAMRIAARHVRGGDDATAIARAWEAYMRPDFCQQLGRDPATSIAAGLAVLRRKLQR